MKAWILVKCLLLINYLMLKPTMTWQNAASFKRFPDDSMLCQFTSFSSANLNHAPKTHKVSKVPYGDFKELWVLHNFQIDWWCQDSSASEEAHTLKCMGKTKDTNAIQLFWSWNLATFCPSWQIGFNCSVVDILAHNY